MYILLKNKTTLYRPYIAIYIKKKGQFRIDSETNYREELVSNSETWIIGGNSYFVSLVKSLTQKKKKLFLLNQARNCLRKHLNLPKQGTYARNLWSVNPFSKRHYIRWIIMETTWRPQFFGKHTMNMSFFWVLTKFGHKA